MKIFLGLIDCWFVFKIKRKRDKKILFSNIIDPLWLRKIKSTFTKELHNFSDWWITLKEMPLIVSVFNEMKKNHIKIKFVVQGE